MSRKRRGSFSGSGGMIMARVAAGGAGGLWSEGQKGASSRRVGADVMKCTSALNVYVPFTTRPCRYPAGLDGRFEGVGVAGREVERVGGRALSVDRRTGRAATGQWNKVSAWKEPVWSKESEGQGCNVR